MPQGEWEPGDRMKVLTPEGVKVVEVLKKEDASAIGQYWNAVKHFLDTGDDRRLRPFEGKTVERVEREEFQTDLDAIEEEARRGEIGFEDIYEG